MKKLFLLTVLVALMLTATAQDTPPDGNPYPVTKQDFLQKSKKQRTAGIILLAGGGTVTIIGITIAAQHFDLFDLEERDETLETVLIAVGGAAMLGSIPLFVSAKKNKRTAMSMSFKNERSLQLQNGLVHLKRIPSVNFRLSF
jgi:hypothetical protein